MVGRRYYRSIGMYIQYLPGKPKQLNRELYRVSDVLTDGMETITLKNGDLLRGTNRCSKIENGILNFFVNYNLFVIKPAEATPDMGEIEAEVKKG